jgi:hypothetical protein
MRRKIGPGFGDEGRISRIACKYLKAAHQSRAVAVREVLEGRGRATAEGPTIGDDVVVSEEVSEELLGEEIGGGERDGEEDEEKEDVG